MHLVHLCQAFLFLQNRRLFPCFPPSTIYCLYDAFIASKLCTTKMGFQLWEQIKVRRSHIRRIWGMRKDFKSTFSPSSHGNLWRVGRGIVMQKQKADISFPYVCWMFLDILSCEKNGFLILCDDSNNSIIFSLYRILKLWVPICPV